jgi:hypothetical protein
MGLAGAEGDSWQGGSDGQVQALRVGPQRGSTREWSSEGLTFRDVVTITFCKQKTAGINLPSGYALRSAALQRSIQTINLSAKP